MVFYSYYYYSDLIYCSFCMFYFFCYDYDENFSNFKLISGLYNFICTNCLKNFNFLVFNYYFEYHFESNNFLKFYYKSYKTLISDNYENYIYCNEFCLKCLTYYDINLKKNHSNFYCCKFFEIISINNYFFKDFYELYIYCLSFKNCIFCLKYYNFFYFNFLNFDIIKNYYNEFYMSYLFNKTENNTGFNNILVPEEIYFFLDKYVVGQNKPKKTISVSIYNHYKRIRMSSEYTYHLDKSNILMIGSSGCGKTFLIKTLSKLLDIPIIIVDATTFTETGYVGDNVEVIIQKLFNESDFNIELTEIGLVFIDEIDKISSKNLNSNNRDISGQGVQQALLKIIEGTYCSVNCYDENDYPLFFSVNTEDILFICGGAFPGIEKISINNNDDIDEKNEFYKYDIFNSEKLIAYGLIPEFIGRLPIIIKFDNLDIFFLKKIILSSENSLLDYYNNLFFLENIRLNISFQAVDLISKFAYKKNLGSRGLRNIFENILIDLMYKTPNLEGLSSISIYKAKNPISIIFLLLRYDI
ncbi:MAG: ATP-dependent Clp protease ATP-binding subunit ClpX [Candidatus Nasuia deltocephalinicola]